MKRMLYLTAWDFSESQTNGICKKILAQIKVFRQKGFEVDFAYTENGKIFLDTNGEVVYLGSVPRKLNIFLCHKLFMKGVRGRQYDAVYVRHSVTGPYYIRLLSVLANISKKVIVEVPTFPYDAELEKSFFERLGLFVDHMFRNKMKKYVNRIVTFSEHDSIFNIPTIKTTNGIDFSSIPQVNYHSDDNVLNLIGVAMLSPWHGFDRIIRGLQEYYQSERKVVVKFHIVGEGTEQEKYKTMVQKGNLEQYVFFYGNQSGEQLDAIYDQANVAVSSIGLHRINIEKASPLKSREYGARGLLMVSSCKIDFIPEEGLVFYVPADESDIRIEKLVHFYFSAVENSSLKEVGDRIREYTKKVADMEITFEPIIQYINE